MGNNKETMTETVENKGFMPPRQKVIVKPILRQRGMINDPTHEAYFLFGRSAIKYCLPQKGGILVTPFSSKAEQEWLERELDVDLNIYKSKDNYWKSKEAKVRMTKDYRTLNLENPHDYRDWLILKACTNQIAPDGQSMMKKKTYRYALVEESFENEKKASKADNKKKAYKLLGALEVSNDKMLSFLKVYGKRVDSNSKRDFLVGLLDEIIEKDIEGFIKLAEDKTFDVKLLLEDAVEAGALTKTGKEYYLPGGDKLSANDKTPATVTNAVAYLTDPANQDILLQLKARVKSTQ